MLSSFYRDLSWNTLGYSVFYGLGSLFPHPFLNRSDLLQGTFVHPSTKYLLLTLVGMSQL